MKMKAVMRISFAVHAAMMSKIELAVGRFNSNANPYLAKGNKAAGVRSRTASKELGKLLKEWRKATVKGGNDER